MRILLPVFRLFLVSASLTCCAACFWGQGAVLTASQKDVCRVNGFTDRCASLVEEFTTLHQAQRSGSGMGLLTAWFDAKTFSQERAQSAFKDNTIQELENRYKQLALQAISTRAAVTQVGADSGASTGSTNLVSKPTTTDLLSIASESGAFTDTVNGTSVTLQANANGLAKLFSKREIFALAQPSWSAALQPLNFTVTLNVSQTGTGSAVPTSGTNLGTAVGTALGSVLLPENNASISAFSARYNVYRPNDPTSAAFQTKIDAAITKHQPDFSPYTTALADSIQKSIVPVSGSAAYGKIVDAWKSSASEAEQKKDFTAFVVAYKTYTQQTDALLTKAPDIEQTLLALNAALQGLQGVTDSVMNEARGTPLATVTYTYATPTQQPATHQFGIVGGYLFKGGHKDKATGETTGRTFSSGAQVNFNFAATLFADQPTIVTNGRLRDFQVSAEFDKPFGGTSDDPRATWSVAGYGQYQYNPTVLNITAGNLAPGTNITLPSNAQVLLGTAGWLGVVQGKLAINLNKGLTIPVALKWSNKTSLLDANDIRGQIGISYDLSALSKLITGSSSATP